MRAPMTPLIRLWIMLGMDPRATDHGHPRLKGEQALDPSYTATLAEAGWLASVRHPAGAPAACSAGETEAALGDDVLLYFRGAAGDAQRAAHEGAGV